MGQRRHNLTVIGIAHNLHNTIVKLTTSLTITLGQVRFVLTLPGITRAGMTTGHGASPVPMTSGTLTCDKMTNDVMVFEKA